MKKDTKKLKKNRIGNYGDISKGNQTKFLNILSQFGNHTMAGQPYSGTLYRELYGCNMTEKEHLFLQSYEKSVDNMRKNWSVLKDFMPLHRLKEGVIKNLINNGIPPERRFEVWRKLLNTHSLEIEVQGKFDDWSGRARIDGGVDARIDVDLLEFGRLIRNRYLTEGNELNILRDIKETIVVFLWKHPTLVYYKELSHILSTIFLTIRNKVTVFCILHHLFVDILNNENFSTPKLTENTRLNTTVLNRILSSDENKMHRMFEKINNFQLDNVSNGWFTGLFCDKLPMESVYRILDCVFLYGENFLYKVCMTILCHLKNDLLKCKDSEMVEELFASIFNNNTFTFNADLFLKAVHVQEGHCLPEKVLSLKEKTFLHHTTTTSPTIKYTFDDFYGFDTSSQACKTFLKKYHLYNKKTNNPKWKLSTIENTCLWFLNLSAEKQVHLINGGIPAEKREFLWWKLSGGDEMRVLADGNYGDWLGESRANIGRDNVVAIERDIPRLFQNNRFFVGSEGGGMTESSRSVRNILHTLCYRNPRIGYIQGLDNIVATLLLSLQNEEKTFWVMQCLFTHILPADYYENRDFLIQRADISILLDAMILENYEIANHIKSCSISEMFMDMIHVIFINCYVTLFTKLFTIETSNRILDCLFFYGFKIIPKTLCQIILSLKDEFSRVYMHADFSMVMCEYTNYQRNSYETMEVIEGMLKRFLVYENDDWDSWRVVKLKQIREEIEAREREENGDGEVVEDGGRGQRQAGENNGDEGEVQNEGQNGLENDE